MDNAVKTKIFVVTGILIILAAVSFQFDRVEPQKIILEQGGNKNSEPVQVAPLAAFKANADQESEVKKMMPVAVPLFMYHYIRDYVSPSDPIGENLSVSREKFEEQIVWLKENGYQSVPLNFFEIPQPVSFKPIILTFDDGYQDAFDAAFPVLRKYGMTGIFYLIVGKIGTPGYLTWDEIAQMQAEGMFFGSHTLSHPDLRNLSKINLEKEVAESKKILEQKLGREIADFCYPSGKYNSDVLKAVQAAGYKTAVTTASGIATLQSNPYLLSRLRITQSTNIRALLPKL